MPVAHACPVCGNQLTRTRAVLDAVYALPIVRCDCGHVAVRRRHPLTVKSRRVLVIAGAIARLVLQLILVFVLTSFTAACVRGLEHDLRDLKYSPISFLRAMLTGTKDHERLSQTWGVDRNGYIFLICFAAVSLATGIWLRTGLSHWRWPRPFLAWIVAASFMTWIDVVFWPIEWAVDRFAGEHAPYDGPTTTQCSHIATILGMSLIVTLLGTPIGQALTRLGPPIHRFFFVRRLAKFRKRRRAS